MAPPPFHLSFSMPFSPDFVTFKIVIFYLLDTKHFVSLRHPN